MRFVLLRNSPSSGDEEAQTVLAATNLMAWGDEGRGKREALTGF
jgi:hypothetical protein